jgi:hypothetical protein
MSIDITYQRMTTAILERLQVAGAWRSWLRIGVAFLVGLLVLGRVVAPDAPTYLERDVVADEPRSDVRYVAPTNRADVAGFLAPDPNDGEFNVAWIGGSEIKLNAVSLPGEFSARVEAVGNEQLVIDAYSIIGMRALDTYRAAVAAIDNDADALVIVLNPTFTTDEWSLSEWRNLDVSDPTALLSDRRTVPWFIALTSPGDMAQGAGIETVPLLKASVESNRRQQGWFDTFDVLLPANDAQIAATTAEADERLPTDSTSFWLLQDLGGGGADVASRIVGIVDGFGVGTGQSDSIMNALVDLAGDAEIPVYMYAAALDPTFINDDRYAPTAVEIERRWERLQNYNTHDNVIVVPEMLSREFATEVAYFDPIHTQNAGPLADLLVERLCAQWMDQTEGACR